VIGKPVRIAVDTDQVKTGAGKRQAAADAVMAEIAALGGRGTEYYRLLQAVPSRRVDG